MKQILRSYLNWKTYLALAALLLMAASLIYTSRLARDLGAEERKRVAQVAQAIKSLAEQDGVDKSFQLQVIEENNTIPLIITDAHDSITDYVNNHRNLDLSGVSDTLTFIERRLQEFRKLHPPIEIDFGAGKNFIYYGDSSLLSQLRLFPYVQMVIITLFIIVIVVAISVSNRARQNQVWVGLSKETAHQLGTPLTSITGWLELLREEEKNHEAVAEMEKDLARLQLVADRFGKVGATPQLSEEDLIRRLQGMVAYMQKRAPATVSISLSSNASEIPLLLSGPLFDWVIENLIRNALDAMDGKGEIKIVVNDTGRQIVIDVCDNGKGIPRHLVKKIFNPGFSTKKRGWGLGLSLAKRIIDNYHKGSLFVKSTEPGKGTTFRVILRR